MDYFISNKRVQVRWLSGISILFILIILATNCDKQSLTDVGKIESTNSPTENNQKPVVAAFNRSNIPSHGKTPLPGSQGIGRPAGDFLQKYARNHPQNSYAAIVGNWNYDKHRYEYKMKPLTFSQSTSGKGYYRL